MNFTETKLKGNYYIDLNPSVDERGWFTRTYCKKEFSGIGSNKEWVQINHSFTEEKGTIRGMHFQFPPYSEVKLIRCVSGAIFEVVVDLRAGSETFMQWIGIELSAENKRMMYVPEGFAHGFQSLCDNVELIYHHSNYYLPESEGGIAFDDPVISIEWPLKVTCISERDKNHIRLTKNFEGLKID